MVEAPKYDLRADKAAYRAARKTIRAIEKRAAAALKERLKAIAHAASEAREIQDFSSDISELLADRD